MLNVNQATAPVSLEDDNANDGIGAVIDRLDRIESTLAALVEQKSAKEWYSTGEVARILQKAEFTVREWCRLKRVNAKKRPCGRGLSAEWMISHVELQRIQNEGLLPLN